jgi:hypothetical protein
LKIFVAYLISKAIGFSRYVAKLWSPGVFLPWAYGILPCRLNSFTLGNPGSAYLRISEGTLKIFVAYLISKAIGFSRYVAKLWSPHHIPGYRIS